jgi:hypothetical protein
LKVTDEMGWLTTMVQRTGASRLARRRIEPQRLLAPVADLYVAIPNETSACPCEQFRTRNGFHLSITRIPMIPRRRKLFASILLLSLPLLVACAVWSHFREPRAEGKPISYWIHHLRIGVKVLHNPHPDGASSGRTYTVMLPNLTDKELASLIVSTNVLTVGHGSATTQFFPPWPDRVDLRYVDKLEEDPADRVIKNMGTTALPYLRAGLHRRESPAVTLFCKWVWSRLPTRLQGWIGTPVHPVHMRANSAYALGLLGAASSPAVPELQSLLSDNEDCLVRSVALEALQRIKPGIAGHFYPELFGQTQPELRNLPTGTTNMSDLFSHKMSL